MKAALPYVALCAVVLGLANFSWFFAESVSLHGDALNGYQSGGHFFVGSHGTYTEVGRDAWEWSRLHAMSLFVTHPVALAGMAYLVLKIVLPNAWTTRGTGGSSRVVPNPPMQSGRRAAPPQGVQTALELVGVVVGFGLVAAGLLWAIPNLGTFGIIWTLLGAGITVSNLSRFIRERRR